MNEQGYMAISELTAAGCPAKAAIFDFDGTISTLRCGWESIMEKMMYRHLSGGSLGKQQLIAAIRAYIDDSTGIQTIYQMEWLAEKVGELHHTTAKDPWEYKDEYNHELLTMVNQRIEGLTNGTMNPDTFFVSGSRTFLQKLHDAGIQIYIASGTDEADVQREAGLLGVMPFVRSVKGAPPRQKDCSKAAVIKELLQTHSLSGRQLLVVGDGKVEISLGNEVNAITIGIASNELLMDGTPHPKKLEKLRQAGANYIVPDFNILNAQWELFRNS